MELDRSGVSHQILTGGQILSASYSLTDKLQDKAISDMDLQPHLWTDREV